MEENGDTMRVFIEGEDDLIDVNRPVYNALEGQFQFRAQTGRYTVTEFWPVRMKLKQSGNSSYIISVNIVNESEEWLDTIVNVNTCLVLSFVFEIIVKYIK